MIRAILALIYNDLAIALKNKTIYLTLFIPLFVFVSLKLLDSTDVEPNQARIGLVQHYDYAPRIVAGIKAAEKTFAVTWVQTREQGLSLLQEKVLDGMLLPHETAPDRLELLVLKKETLATVVIVESFSALQDAVEGGRINWIGEIKALHQGGFERQTLPTWILMLTLLVGFIILPAQVAEEKEKKLLLALLQTPIREVQWLIAKVITGMALTMLAILFLHLLGSFGVVNLSDYLALIVVGSFCFSAYGVFLGFLCRNQASARTLGLLFYLPHLLPSALADFSQKLTVVAPLLPSYQFYEPIKAVLLEESGVTGMAFELTYLLLVGLLAFYLSFLLIKKRWLM